LNDNDDAFSPLAQACGVVVCQAGLQINLLSADQSPD